MKSFGMLGIAGGAVQIGSFAANKFLNMNKTVSSTDYRSNGRFGMNTTPQLANTANGTRFNFKRTKRRF